MPSTAKLVLDLTVTAGLLLGGAALAAYLPVRAAAQAPAQAGDDAGLRLTIEGVRSDQGRVVALVFDDPAGFAAYDVDRAVAWADQPARTGAVALAFEDLTRGPYAVFAFHDEDGDYDLAMEGDYPLEGYGGTGMARWYDEPSFEAAAVEPGATSFTLHYLD